MVKGVYGLTGWPSVCIVLYMNTTTKAQPTARQKLTAKIEGQTTRQLLAHHGAIDKMADKDEATRLVSALIGEEISLRLDLDEALTTIYNLDDAENFWTGTHHEALLAAIVATGQDEAL